MSPDVPRASRPALLFYCQHSLGLGHLARSLRVAAALCDRFDVVLLNGGRFPAGTTVPPGITVVNLPPLGHDADYRLVSHDPDLSVEAVRTRRAELILATFARIVPRVVLVEMYPFGRKKFEFELLPFLDAAMALGADRPHIICSLRDILVNQRRDQERYDERVSLRVNRYFDAVLVHADPAFVRLEESFAPLTPMRVPVHYTGFVAPPATVDGSDKPEVLPRVLVSSGGGMVGEPLVRAAVAVHERLAARTGLTTTVVAGPFLPEPVWQWLQDESDRSPSLTVVRRVPDLAQEMRRSTVTLSQAGYNTTMDILRAGTPAVVVPFSEGTEDEQTRRADRLAALGILRTVPAVALSADRLLDELCAAASTRPAAVTLDLSGDVTTARIIAAVAGLPDEAAARRGAA